MRDPDFQAARVEAERSISDRAAGGLRSIQQLRRDGWREGVARLRTEVEENGSDAVKAATALSKLLPVPDAPTVRLIAWAERYLPSLPDGERAAAARDLNDIEGSP